MKFNPFKSKESVIPQSEADLKGPTSKLEKAFFALLPYYDRAFNIENPKEYIPYIQLWMKEADEEVTKLSAYRFQLAELDKKLSETQKDGPTLKGVSNEMISTQNDLTARTESLMKFVSIWQSLQEEFRLDPKDKEKRIRQVMREWDHIKAGDSKGDYLKLFNKK